jgi:hypothetical protein
MIVVYVLIAAIVIALLGWGVKALIRRDDRIHPDNGPPMTGE